MNQNYICFSAVFFREIWKRGQQALCLFIALASSSCQDTGGSGGASNQCVDAPLYSEVVSIEESASAPGTFDSVVTFSQFHTELVTLSSTSFNGYMPEVSTQVAFLNYWGFFPVAFDPKTSDQRIKEIDEDSLSTAEFEAAEPLSFGEALVANEHYEVLTLPEGLSVDLRMGSETDEVMVQVLGTASNHAPEDKAEIVLVLKNYWEYNRAEKTQRGLTIPFYQIDKSEETTVKIINLEFL